MALAKVVPARCHKHTRSNEPIQDVKNKGSKKRAQTRNEKRTVTSLHRKNISTQPWNINTDLLIEVFQASLERDRIIVATQLEHRCKDLKKKNTILRTAGNSMCERIKTVKEKVNEILYLIFWLFIPNHVYKYQSLSSRIFPLEFYFKQICRMKQTKWQIEIQELRNQFLINRDNISCSSSFTLFPLNKRFSLPQTTSSFIQNGLCLQWQ